MSVGNFHTQGQAPAASRMSMVWPVGALCQAIADTLQARFSGLVVEGELTGFSRAASGHCYFSLKDAQGQLRCAMFRRAASLLAFHPREGDKVQVRGRLDLYGPRGELQLIVESMQQAGQGALFEQFLRLKGALQAEGLFDNERKRAVPHFPRGIGVVTSLGAAALRDVVTTLQRRAPHVPVVIANAQVQGTQAASEIRAALGSLAQLAGFDASGGDERTAHQAVTVDVILVVRGGGAIEDLWAFNDESLARAIAACPVPVVTGVGHETDFTIADFVADIRAPTPTAAAELVSDSRAHLMSALVHQNSRLQSAVLRGLDQRAQWLDQLTARLGRPSDQLALGQHRLARLRQAMDHAVQNRMTLAHHRFLQLAPRLTQQVTRQMAVQQQGLNHLGHALQVLDPGHVLRRGFSWLQNEQGQAITGVDQVKIGESLSAHLADGQLRARVEAVSTKLPPQVP